MLALTGDHAFGYDVEMATVTLSPGPHALRVDYFQDTGYVALSVMFAPISAANTAAVHLAAAAAADAAVPIDSSMLTHSAVRQRPHH